METENLVAIVLFALGTAIGANLKKIKKFGLAAKDKLTEVGSETKDKVVALTEAAKETVGDTTKKVFKHTTKKHASKKNVHVVIKKVATAR